ncbi:MAG: hypothetical protein SPF17_05445 [Candidatus Mucispirillum faecigallinarum]|nr:hypothetical protein [Candidatus Mucispirillum faecigallinarum]
MIPQQPKTILSPLGYSSDTRNIPATTPAGTNQLSFESGFPLLTGTPIQAGGIPPERQDFNAAFKLLSEFAYYMQSGNHFTWSNQLDYDEGATVIGSDNAIYYCIQANGATEPNTVQNPTNSTGYWVQIITSAGKINASALSVTLGLFAQLNSLALTDNKLTGILPLSKGGLGTNTIEGAQAILNINNTVTTLYPTQDLNKSTQGVLICSSNYLTNKPASINSGVVMIETNLNKGNNTFGESGAYGYNLQTYRSRSGFDYAQRVCSPTNNIGEWVKMRNYDGTIPTNCFANNSIPAAAIQSVASSQVTGLATVATSGSYNDLTNKPTIPTNVAPLPVTGSGIGQWEAVGPAAQVQLPDGGTWAIFVSLFINGALSTKSYIVDIVSGGTSFSTNISGGLFAGLAWRIQ